MKNRKNTVLLACASILMFLIISTGAMVNGECKVGKNCFIGSQSVLANCITLGDDIIVGAGSFVRKSLTEKGIYSGNPAILKVKI